MRHTWNRLQLLSLILAATGLVLIFGGILRYNTVITRVSELFGFPDSTANMMCALGVGALGLASLSVLVSQVGENQQSQSSSTQVDAFGPGQSSHQEPNVSPSERGGGHSNPLDNLS